MISINQQKLLRSLHRKKKRDELGQFLVEGDKLVADALDKGASIKQIYATAEWLDDHPEVDATLIIEADKEELKKISQLTTAHRVVALIDKNQVADDFQWKKNTWYVALEGVRDPGNMGTIIRTADWFGIDTLLVTSDCVERYNAKVIQSTMGSIFNTKEVQVDLVSQVKKCVELGIPVYAASLTGENINGLNNPKPGLILFGNESKGLSDEIIPLVDYQILIPGRGGAESLNVAISAGIILAWAAGIKF